MEPRAYIDFMCKLWCRAAKHGVSRKQVGKKKFVKASG